MEFGCGSGNFLKKASQYGINNLAGTEFNAYAIAAAQQNGLTIFRPDEIPNHLKEQYDAVFSFHVLEHVDDPIAFMKELCSWVKPGGVIGISVPNMDGPVRHLDPCVSNMPPHHATRWRTETFKALATYLGLELRRIAYEPLHKDNYSYYSYYWLGSVLGFNTLSHKFLGGICNAGFYFGYLILGMARKDSIPLLKGQSMYVLMVKPYG